MHLHLFHTFAGKKGKIVKVGKVNKSGTFAEIGQFLLHKASTQRCKTNVNMPKCFDMHATISVVCTLTRFWAFGCIFWDFIPSVMSLKSQKKLKFYKSDLTISHPYKLTYTISKPLDSISCSFMSFWHVFEYLHPFLEVCDVTDDLKTSNFIHLISPLHFSSL